MKIARLSISIIVVALALTLVSAGPAAASARFRAQDVGKHFVGLSGTFVFQATTGLIQRLQCANSSSLGIIASTELIGTLSIVFQNCRQGNGKEECEVNSEGEKGGSIAFRSLHAVLGLFLPRSGSGVGLLVLPGSGNILLRLSGNKCSEEEGGETVEGSFAGEVTPVGVVGTLTSVTFALSNANPKILDIDVTGGLRRPELLFVRGATRIRYATEGLVTLHWGSSIEIT
jgi:hypothetical protein